MIDIDSLPVTPKQYVVFTHRGEDHLAAMMPYPMTDAEDAPCAEHGDLFTTDVPRPGRGGAESLVSTQMRAICDSCPFRLACAEWGIAHETNYMWGGLTPAERKVIRKARRQVVVEPSAPQEYGFAPAYIQIVTLHDGMFKAGDPDGEGATD